VIVRRGRSAAELADRWQVSPTVALEFLWGFRDAGLAVETRGVWYATRRALERYGWLTGYGKRAA
jgi:hypothetical protein